MSFPGLNSVTTLPLLIDDSPFVNFTFIEDLNTQMNEKKATQMFQIDEISLEDEMNNLRCNVFLKLDRQKLTFGTWLARKIIPI